MDDRPQWPTVIGTIGIVLGFILLVDKVDDVMTLRWTAQEWRRIFAPDLADLIARTMPPVAWRVFSAAAQISLAVFLIVGALALRRRTRNGVSLCRLWAWLAIIWVLVTVGRGVLWLQQHAGELPELASVSWQGYAAFGIVVAVALLLAFPVFLLVWLSQPAVRAEYGRWG